MHNERKQKIMKKNVVALFLVTVLLFSLCSCGTANEKAEGTVEKVRIAFMVPDSLGDLSFWDSTQAGLEKLVDEGIATLKTVEVNGDNTKFAATLEDLSCGDYDIVVTGDWSVQADLETIAAAHPEMHYIYNVNTVDFSDGKNSNVHCIMFNCNENSFIAGAFSALVTESEMEHANEDKIIGYIGGDEGITTYDFLVGYIAGATMIDPEIKVVTCTVGNWSDASKTKELALNLNEIQRCDIIYPNAGRGSLGAFDAAKEKGFYTIGLNCDQAHLFIDNDPEKANLILTSCLADVGEACYRAIKKDLAGELEWGTVEYVGIDSGVLDICLNDVYQNNVPEDIRAQMAEIREKAFAGEYDIPSAYEMTDSEIQEYIASVKPR